MSIFGDRTTQGSFEDARRLQVCGTCKRDILPPASLPGLGYHWSHFCQCVKVQTRKEAP
jgi:hypothetical protein